MRTGVCRSASFSLPYLPTTAVVVVAVTPPPAYSNVAAVGVAIIRVIVWRLFQHRTGPVHRHERE